MPSAKKTIGKEPGSTRAPQPVKAKNRSILELLQAQGFEGTAHDLEQILDEPMATAEEGEPSSHEEPPPPQGPTGPDAPEGGLLAGTLQPTQLDEGEESMPQASSKRRSDRPDRWSS